MLDVQLYTYIIIQGYPAVCRGVNIGTTHQSAAIATMVVQRLAVYTDKFTQHSLSNILVSTICSLGRCSAVLHASCVPPPEVPQEQRTKVARLDLFSEEQKELAAGL